MCIRLIIYLRAYASRNDACFACSLYMHAGRTRGATWRPRDPWVHRVAVDRPAAMVLQLYGLCDV